MLSVALYAFLKPLWQEGISAWLDSVDGTLSLGFNLHVGIGDLCVVSRANFTDHARMRSCRANMDIASLIGCTGNQSWPTCDYHTGIGELRRRGS
jgi:hypothetical protein